MSKKQSIITTILIPTYIIISIIMLSIFYQNYLNYKTLISRCREIKNSLNILQFLTN